MITAWLILSAPGAVWIGIDLLPKFRGAWWWPLEEDANARLRFRWMKRDYVPRQPERHEYDCDGDEE